MTLSQEERLKRQILKLEKKKEKMLKKEQKKKEKLLKKKAKDLIKKQKVIKKMGKEIIKRQSLPKIKKPRVNPLKSNQVLRAKAEAVRLEEIKKELRSIRGKRDRFQKKVDAKISPNAVMVSGDNNILRIMNNKIESLIDERKDIKRDSGKLDLPPLRRQ